MKSLTDSVFIASLQGKKPKCAITNASSTTAGGTVKRWIDGRMHTSTRLLVFEENEANNGAVDTANNRRDNIPSSHDVMKTYCWEMRCLSFFLAVAEDNVFSAHKYVELEDGTSHFDFRWRLGQSPLDHARIMNDDLNDREPYQLRQANTGSSHTIIFLGKLPNGEYRRLRCIYCHTEEFAVLDKQRATVYYRNIIKPPLLAMDTARLEQELNIYKQTEDFKRFWLERTRKQIRLDA